MTALDERLERYAELLVVKGCALKQGQELFVRSPLEVAAFTRKVVACAYAHGAKLVTVDFDKVKAAGFNTVTLMTVLNTAALGGVTPKTGIDVKPGDVVLEISR